MEDCGDRFDESQTSLVPSELWKNYMQDWRDNPKPADNSLDEWIIKCAFYEGVGRTLMALPASQDILTKCL
jgi:hypothetical protein